MMINMSGIWVEKCQSVIGVRGWGMLQTHVKLPVHYEKATLRKSNILPQGLINQTKRLNNQALVSKNDDSFIN